MKSEAKKRIRVFFVIKVVLFIFTNLITVYLYILYAPGRRRIEMVLVIIWVIVYYLIIIFLHIFFTSYGMTTLLIPEKRYS